MSLIEQANNIINVRSEEKERMYGPIKDGMIAAGEIAKYLTDPHNSDSDLYAFKYLYGLKLSRQKYNHKEDNILDAIAYRIAEVNAMLELIEIDAFNIDTFNICFNTHTANMHIEFSKVSQLICSLTTLELKGDDIYKIMLSIEIENERLGIEARSHDKIVKSIMRQIAILEKMNTFNNNIDVL